MTAEPTGHVMWSQLVADSETELVLSAPFEIKLPISEITS